MLLSGTSSLKDKVANLSDYPILLAATHSDPNPTPPHISQRVVSISFVSRQKCVYLMEHLLDLAQSSSKSLHSRLKAVRLLQELVLKGDPEFQPLLQKEEHKLKAVASFLDPQAPLESSRLREATAGLLEVLFEETNRSFPPAAPFTPPATSHGLVSPSYRTSQYQGFGNPHFVQNRASSNSGILSLVSEKVSDLFSHVPAPDPNRFSSRDYSARSVNDPPMASNYAQNTFYSGARHSYPSVSRDTLLPDALPHTPGMPGAEWDSYRRTDSPPQSYPAARPEPRVNGSYERGEERQLERQLVLSFTAEGGVRSRPSRQELEEFIARSRSLDCSLLAELLASQVGPQGTGNKLKTLFALEALYRSFPAQTGEVITAHSEEISCLSAKGDTPSVRTKAGEILSILGIPSLLPTDSSANSSLIQTNTSANNSLIQTDSDANSTLIQTDSTDLTQALSGITSSPLVSTETTDSLFDGMLTHTEDTTLIAGLEEFALPELGHSNAALSDMINLGTTKAPCQFDPLLDIGHTSVPTAPLSLSAFNTSNLPNYTAPASQSYSTIIPIQRHEPTKSVKTDSFGFISEHIQSLKEIN